MFTLTSDSDLVIGRYQKSGKRCSWFECPRCKELTCHKSCQNRPRSIYQHSNMATRLSAQTSMFVGVFFVSKSLWELKDKGNLKKLRFWPESLGSMLEYYISNVAYWLWFWGFLACPELYSDWFSTKLTFWNQMQMFTVFWVSQS